jgi:hypothetical protein
MMVEPEEDQAIIEWTAIDKLSADELFNLILLLPEGYRNRFQFIRN